MRAKNGPMPTLSRDGLLKDPGFLACTIFLCLGVITSVLAAIPLIICSLYEDHMFIGLSDDLKIAGVGFLIFGLLVVIFAILGMVYTGDKRRKKRDEMVDYILEDNDEMGCSRPPGFTNPVFQNSDVKVNNLKDVPL